MREKQRGVKSIFAGIAAAVFVAAFASCGAETQNAQKERGIVRFGSSAGESGILVGAAGVARELNYIQEELGAAGFDVEFYGFVNGVAVNEAFAAGELEFSTLGDVPAAVGFSNNIGTVWIANGFSYGDSEILARTGTNIKTVKDLEGKKLAYGVGTTTEYLWQQIVRKYGIDEKKVEVVNLGGAHIINALETKDVDAIIHSERWTQQLVAQGKGTVIASTNDEVQWRPQDTIVGRAAFLKEHPQTGVAVLKALIRAREAVIANPDPYYVTLSARQLEKNPEIAKTIYNKDKGTFINIDSYIHEGNIKREQALADFLESVGRIAKHVVIKDHVDNSYWEKADEQLKKK